MLPPLSSQIFPHPPPGSLRLITSVLGASANWIVLSHIWAVLKPEDSTSANDESEFRVILISWLRGLDFWKDTARKLGLNLSADERISFVDALQLGLGLQSGDIRELAKQVLKAIKETASTNTKALLILDGIDFLLAATDFTLDELLDTIWALRDHVHATIISASADFPLIQAHNTPLELHHAAFVLSIAHQARAIWGVRELDTGSARDVSGVLRITRGPAVEEQDDVQFVEVEEKELLYHVAGDGGVKRRVPRPLASATTKPILSADAAVVVPSTSRNTPAHHAAIPQLRSVNVRTSQPSDAFGYEFFEGHWTAMLKGANPSVQHRQLGHESEAEKDYRHGANANHEGDTEKVQERFSDWNTKGGEGACNSVDVWHGQ
ncbi:MAG: hypothetical protein Q9188_001098 [Gyalolechia gomerana]